MKIFRLFAWPLLAWILCFIPIIGFPLYLFSLFVWVGRNQKELYEWFTGNILYKKDEIAEDVLNDLK